MFEQSVIDYQIKTKPAVFIQESSLSKSNTNTDNELHFTLQSKLPKLPRVYSFGISNRKCTILEPASNLRGKQKMKQNNHNIVVSELNLTEAAYPFLPALVQNPWV